MHVLTDPLLAECRDGAVALCPCCGLPVVAYGDNRVTLRPEQLLAMLHTVRQIGEAAAEPGACWTWALRAKTDREDATFRLTADDAAALADLLDEAAAVLALDDMLSDVFQSEPR